MTSKYFTYEKACVICKSILETTAEPKIAELRYHHCKEVSELAIKLWKDPTYYPEFRDDTDKISEDDIKKYFMLHDIFKYLDTDDNHGVLVADILQNIVLSDNEVYNYDESTKEFYLYNLINAIRNHSCKTACIGSGNFYLHLLCDVDTVTKINSDFMLMVQPTFFSDKTYAEVLDHMIRKIRKYTVENNKAYCFKNTHAIKSYIHHEILQYMSKTCPGSNYENNIKYIEYLINSLSII